MKGPILVRTGFVASALVIAIVLGFPTLHLHASKAGGEGSRQIKAVAFDYLVLFNPDSVVDDVEQVFPGKGREFTNLWRTRQFDR